MVISVNSNIEQQVTSQNTIEMVRCRLEEVRNKNLENASFKDKQELIARLGIIVYPSEDHKTVRITSKLPILQDKFSPQIMNMASPILIIPREHDGTQVYPEMRLLTSNHMV